MGSARHWGPVAVLLWQGLGAMNTRYDLIVGVLFALLAGAVIVVAALVIG